MQWLRAQLGPQRAAQHALMEEPRPRVQQRQRAAGAGPLNEQAAQQSNTGYHDSGFSDGSEDGHDDAGSKASWPSHASSSAGTAPAMPHGQLPLRRLSVLNPRPTSTAVRGSADYDF